MADFNARNKLSRSRSQRLKGESDSTFIKLCRKKPIQVPKSITFIRGTSQRTKQAFLDENKWVTLSESLSSLISHENTVINDYHSQHNIPSPISTSAEAFMSNFERKYADFNNPVMCESFRAFCRSFSSMFSQNVASCLLYESEMHFSDVIKANPLRNSPAIFLLRFLYYIPTLLRGESIDSLVALQFQSNLKLLIDYAEEVSKYYFVLPSSIHQGLSKSSGAQIKSEGSRVVLVLSKSNKHVK